MDYVRGILELLKKQRSIHFTFNTYYIMFRCYNQVMRKSNTQQCKDWSSEAAYITRTNKICNCDICKTASSRGRPKSLKKGRPSHKPEARAFKICSLCLSELGKGQSHKCTAKTLR